MKPLPELTPECFAGCLVGQAVGDAIGFIVEGHPPESCAGYVTEYVRPRKLSGLARGPFAIGQYSDDSQLARELARSLVERQGFDPADYARRIAALFAAERIVGRGMATEQAARRLIDGVSWEDAGTPAPAAGNGSAMRAAPIGLLFADDPAQMARAAHDQGRITHTDPRCSAGAIAVAGAVSLASSEPRADPVEFCRHLSEWTSPFDSFLGEALMELPTRLDEPPGIAVRWIRRVGLPEEHRDEWRGISPFVTGSVLWSIYSFLRTPDDYWEAICTAIEVGGDVDTTAAMTGAVAGSRVGLAGIPEGARELVNDQGIWMSEALVELAYALHELYSTPPRRQGR